MKKIRNAVLSIILASAMGISAMPFAAYAEQLPSKGTYIDENDVRHEVTLVDTKDMDVNQLIEMIGNITPFDDNEWSCCGVFNGNISEDQRWEYSSDTYYVSETETLYSTSMIIYFVQLENDEKAYAVKFPQSDELYLYTLAVKGQFDIYWLETPTISETAGSPINYFENKDVNEVSLTDASISEINEKIGDIVVVPWDEYTYAGEYNLKPNTSDESFMSEDGFMFYAFTNYKYDKATNTLYYVKMNAKMIKTESGEEAYVIKINSDKHKNMLYLYTLARTSDKKRSDNNEKTLEFLRDHSLGDANCDHNVNMADAVLIMQSIANPDKYELTEQGMINADTDGNGITNADALNIQKQLLGL